MGGIVSRYVKIACKSSSVRFLKSCQGIGARSSGTCPCASPRAMNICSVPIPSPVTLSGVRFAANDTPHWARPSPHVGSRRGDPRAIRFWRRRQRFALRLPGQEPGHAGFGTLRPHFPGGMAAVAARDGDQILPPVDGIGRGRGRGGGRRGCCGLRGDRVLFATGGTDTERGCNRSWLDTLYIRSPPVRVTTDWNTRCRTDAAVSRLGNACYGATRAMVLGRRVPDFTRRSRIWAVAVQVDSRSITSWTPASPRESSITIAVGT